MRPHRRFRRYRRYMHRRLHRRMFWWFGMSILFTGLVLGAVFKLAGPKPSDKDGERIERLVASRVAAAWADPAAREQVARTVASDMTVSLTVVDVDGAEMLVVGERCEIADYTAVPQQGDAALGAVKMCSPERGPYKHLFLIAFVLAGMMLWGASGAIARRVVRPLGQVARVAREIGDGKLDSRVQLGRHSPGEIGMLADAINDMAGRIEKQMSDQRELLAAVSHEIRTPLGHMRVLVELARDGEPLRADELEREIVEVDTLVDQLLASSRLEFDSLDCHELDAVDVCARALERAGEPAERLVVETDDTHLSGDPTLLARALANLVENARRHGEQLVSLRVTGNADALRFEVEDRGPGFAEADLERVFESFFRGERKAGSSHASLGLGLALVRRIARAHGGRVWANNGESGARVGFEVLRDAGRSAPG